MQFEERLSIAFVQFVQKTPTRRVGQRFKDRVEVHARQPKRIRFIMQPSSCVSERRLNARLMLAQIDGG